MTYEFLRSVLAFENDRNFIDPDFFDWIRAIHAEHPALTARQIFMLFANVRVANIRELLEIYLPHSASRDQMMVYAHWYTKLLPLAHNSIRFRRASIICLPGWEYKKSFK